jgi:hypothetical protein
LSEVKVGKAAEQEALVSAYIEDARGVIEDPDAGEAALVKAGDQGGALLTSVSSVTVEAINETTKAVHRLNAARKDPHCSAGKVRRLEKTVEALESEHEQLKAVYAQLGEFMGEVKARLRQKADELDRPEDAPTTDAPTGREGEPQAHYFAPSRKNRETDSTADPEPSLTTHEENSFERLRESGLLPRFVLAVLLIVFSSFVLGAAFMFYLTS